MIVDPVQALADVPTATMAKHHSSPAVTIVPSFELQEAGENGQRTLWYAARLSEVLLRALEMLIAVI